jgi:hypothetical protein
MLLPGHLGDGRFRLRAGGVDDQHLDRTKAVGHRSHQLTNLRLISDIGREGLSEAAVVPDGAGHLKRSRLAADAIDSHRQTIARQAPGDGNTQAARAACDQRDAFPCRHHARSIPVRVSAPRPPVGSTAVTGWRYLAAAGAAGAVRLAGAGGKGAGLAATVAASWQAREQQTRLRPGYWAARS